MVKNSVKNKIIITFCVIITLSLAISGGVAYRYCFNILKNQLLNDEIIKINSTARHMDYIVDDIKKFALLIMVDGNIQKYLKMSDNNFFEINYMKSRIKDMLSSLEVQRDYIINMVLIKGESMIFSKAQLMVYLDEHYYAEKIKEAWYTDFVKSGVTSGFSSPYDLPTYDLRSKEGASSTVKSLPYIVYIKDISNPNKVLGQLIINLKFSYFEDYFIADSKENSDFVWADSHNNVLFSKNPSGAIKDFQEIIKTIEDSVPEDTGYLALENGYLIFDRTMKEGWTICSFINNDHIYKATQYLIYFFLLYTVAILVFTVTIILPIITGITRPISAMTKAMKAVGEGNMDVQIEVKGKDELGVLAKGFNKMLASLKDYLNKTVEYEKDKKKIEFSLLLAQINPHFIYNTLHTIIYMAQKSQNYDIVNMVKSFIAVLQDAVKLNKQGLITSLRNEISIVKEYLTIQQYRYRDRFTVEWFVDESLLDCNVPRTIIQPIVENSILHGILPLNRKGIIKIFVEKSDNNILITIMDNGTGMEQEFIDSLLNSDENVLLKGEMRSIGVNNVLGRIKYICGEQYGIDIKSEKDAFTKFIIKLPANL